MSLNEEHIKSVKQTNEDKTKQLEEQIRVRLQQAAEKREIIEKELQEKLKEQVNFRVPYFVSLTMACDTNIHTSLRNVVAKLLV